MGYVTIQVPFSSRDAMVGGSLRGWQVGGSLQSTGRGQSGLGLRHWQRRPGLKLRLALAVRLSVFDAPALTKVRPFPDKN